MGGARKTALRASKTGDASGAAVTHPCIEFREISKRYERNLVLDRVSFSIEPGTMHAVLGENGAGKTTLMKVLMGIVAPNSGEIRIRGERVRFSNTRDAVEHGVGMVFQNSTLIRSLTIEENLALGGQQRRSPSSSAFDILGPIDRNRLVEDLSRAERQLVEIQRLLLWDVDILILDEPSSALTPLEANAMFSRIVELVTHGRTVLFVTHKLREVEQYADRITVLRGGKHIATVSRGEASIPDLASMMVGGAAAAAEVGNALIGQAMRSETVLTVSNVALRRDATSQQMGADVSFDVHESECVGIAGVSGNGQRELIEAIFGKRRSSEKVLYHNRPLKRDCRHEIAYVPDNAIELAVVPTLSVRDNVLLNDIASARTPFWFDDAALNADAEARLKEFKVKYASLGAAADTLSGGNLRKLILAREFANEPALAVIVNPTSGLDLIATREVRNFLKQSRERGCAILLISSDLDEVLELSDRILVFSDRRCVGDMPGRGVDIQHIAELMGGNAPVESGH